MQRLNARTQRRRDAKEKACDPHCRFTGSLRPRVFASLRYPFCNRTLILTLVLVSALCNAPHLAAQTPATETPAAKNAFASPFVDLLKQAGISPTPEDLRALLVRSAPDPKSKDSFAARVAQLGDDDFFKREAAMQSLLQDTHREAGVLEKAAASTDPEVRWRAKLILEQTNKTRADLLYAAFVVIQSHKIEGLAEPLLAVGPVCQTELRRQALPKALDVTATVKDVAVLRQFLKHDDITSRSAAANTLRRLLGAEARADLLPLLNDKRDSVRLSAAEHLVKWDSPEALETLGQLLDSEQTQIRNRSIQLLVATTKIALPYSAFAVGETRSKQAADWRQAIREHLAKNPLR